MQVTLKLPDRLVQDILNLDKSKSFSTAVSDLLAYALLKESAAKETGGRVAVDLLSKEVADIYADDLLTLILSSDLLDEGKEYAVSNFYYLLSGVPAYSSLSIGDKQRLARSFLSAVKKQNAEELKYPRMEILSKTTPRKFRYVTGEK